MGSLLPLSMSHTKEELLNHLGLDQETYTKMAKETDRTYRWLTSEKRHLKKNCKRKPPYDWSDILERSKDEAMERIARSSDPRTSYYWHLASPNEDCPNWIARWFLYHKFRYRDGRNRNPAKADDWNHPSHSHRSSQRHQDERGVDNEGNEGYYNGQPFHHQSEGSASGSGYQTYGYDTDDPNSASASSAYSNDIANTTVQYPDNGESGSSAFYDPVRDARMPNS